MSNGRHSRKRRFQDIYEEQEHSQPEISLNFRAKKTKLEPLKERSERRQSPRFAVEFETVIFYKGTSFRTKTCNVSLSGALLAENIPTAFVGQTLDIVLVRKIGRSSEYYLLKGKALGEPMRSPRLQFLNVSGILAKRLRLVFDAEKPIAD